MGIAARAVELGADALCLGDTIGATTPARVTPLVDAVRSAAPDVPLGVQEVVGHPLENNVLRAGGQLEPRGRSEVSA
jgi:hypothetical protein